VTRWDQFWGAQILDGLTISTMIESLILSYTAMSMMLSDELGFHAVEDVHYVTDIHATVMHLMGLDSRSLDVPGRKRLEIDHGKVITPILS
jgi:hypothetical protein